MTTRTKEQDARTVTEFVALLNRCLAQVEADPEGYTNNPHLYDLQHRIFLRLCHGDIPEFAVNPTEEEKAARY